MPNQTYATISELQARITLDGSPDTGIPEATLQQLLDLFTKIAGQAAATPNVKSDGNSGSG